MTGRLRQVEDTGRARTGGKNASEPTSSNSPSLDLIAKLVAEVGKPTFYDTLARKLGALLDCDRFLVVRYAQYARPAFLVNESISKKAEQLYLASVYRIDPLLRMARTHVPERVLTFERLKQTDTDNVFYDQNYEFGEIFDELVVMLPAVGGVWVAVCIDHPTRNFTDRDVDMVSELYIVLNQLHQLHIERCVYGWRGGYLDDSKMALMICDHRDRVVFQNENWINGGLQELEGKILAEATGAESGTTPITDGQIVHWERLSDDNSVAPNGRSFLVERLAPGYVDLMGGEPVEVFAKTFDLTPREAEIVRLIIKGNPPSLIAERLNVTIGTIRNHKHRLYFKLDITTERELFCLFMDMVLSRSSFSATNP